MLIRIMLVLDSGALRQAVQTVLKSVNEFEICTEIASLAKAHDLIIELRPDILVLDCSLIFPDQLELLQRIQLASPWIKIIGIGEDGDDSLKIGGSATPFAGIIFDDEIQNYLAEAIRAAANGGTWFSVDNNLILEPTLNDELLTDRELEILVLLAIGKADAQIAEILNITKRTVRFHVSNILQKLGAANRTEAVVKAIQKGILNL